jgi:SAM-dependent MidA family methyltransferase
VTRSEFLLRLVEECGGLVRFDRWMREALTHSEFGYYPKGIRAIGGRHGDFATWPGMEGTLAGSVRRWQCDGPGRVMEIGAGDGSLAQGILSGIWRRPKYGIVELSPVLRDLQKQRLRGRVRWFQTVADGLRAWEGKADLVANELVDAFPVRVFRKDSEQSWSEMYVALTDGRACARWLTATPPSTHPAFQHTWRNGQIIEVLTGFEDWLAGWMGEWKDGRLLLVDYGGTCPRLQRAHPAGTLRAYAHHQRLTGADILDGFGRRDITADVDFTSLEAILKTSGLPIRSHTSLAEFLERWGRRPVPRAFQPAAEAFRVIEAGPASERYQRG